MNLRKLLLNDCIKQLNQLIVLIKGESSGNDSIGTLVSEGSSSSSSSRNSVESNDSNNNNTKKLRRSLMLLKGLLDESLSDMGDSIQPHSNLGR